jgi:cyclophilin family peptidyl-prolyl cis-trans isomerase
LDVSLNLLIAMANSGKNSNTSQFFICLSKDPKRYAKLEGKHVVLGHVTDGLEYLSQINSFGTESGNPTIPIWISDCGAIE